MRFAAGYLTLLTLAFCTRTMAALIAYDGADYAPTDTISGINGGTGWNGGWSGVNNVVAASLLYNGVATNGNRFVTDGNNSGSARVIGTNGFEALLQDGKYGKDGTTLWLSFLFRAVTTSANNYAGLTLYNGTVAASNQVLYLGVPTGGTTFGIHAPTNVAPPFGASAASTFVGTNRQTLFVVVKLMFGTPNGDRVFMYINPPNEFEPTNSFYNSAVVNNLNYQFDRLLFASGQTTTIASFDEIRFGETYADVVPLAADRYAVTQLASLPPPGSGGYAVSPLVQDTNGRFYGSTLTGGSNGVGRIFRVDENGSNLVSLHEFPQISDDGTAPAGVILGNDDVLYGGTQQGGNGGLFGNHGILYRLDSDGSDYSILRHLDNQTDGAWCGGRLLQDSDGILYGVLRESGTFTVGQGGGGVIFKMNTNGTGYTVLHLFTNQAIIPASTDGHEAREALIEGPDGMLYGTTLKGGSAGRGTVFRINKNGTGYQIIRHFQNDSQGSGPESKLVYASNGYLYGTTDSSAPLAGGIIFKLKPDGSEYMVIGRPGGAKLRQGSLVEMPDGLLYGTASDGGRPIPASGYLYRIGKDGSDFEVLHEFRQDSLNGARAPWGGFVRGRDDGLYGATFVGGANTGGIILRMSRTGGQVALPVVLTPWYVAASNSFQISFTATPSSNYDVEATAPSPIDWQSVGSVQTDGNGDARYFEALLPGATNRWYRVVEAR